MSTNEIIFDIDQTNSALPSSKEYDDLTGMQRLIISMGIVKTTTGVKTMLFGLTFVALMMTVFNEIGGESPSAKYGNYAQFISENPEFLE